MQESAKPIDLTTVKPPAGIYESIAILACPTPREIDGQFELLGVRGQSEARKSISTLAWRHVRRLQQEFVCHIPRSRLPERGACLLSGPTGSGKTLLAELLCREVLEVPAAIVDVASLAESDSIDQVLAKVLSRLLDAAGGNKVWASLGVICLDGLEKVACPVMGESAASASPDWVLRNWRVQRALHTLLTTESARFHYENGQQRVARPMHFPHVRVSLVATGNVSGQEAAFLPELLAAFSRRVELDPLGKVELQSILVDLIHRQRRLLEPGLRIDPSRETLDELVDLTLESGQGARMLRDEVASLVEQVVHPQEEGGER